MRRLRFTIRFELPDVALRRRLWRAAFPDGDAARRARLGRARRRRALRAAASRPPPSPPPTWRRRTAASSAGARRARPAPRVREARSSVARARREGRGVNGVGSARSACTSSPGPRTRRSCAARSRTRSRAVPSRAPRTSGGRGARSRTRFARPSRRSRSGADQGHARLVRQDSLLGVPVVVAFQYNPTEMTRTLSFRSEAAGRRRRRSTRRSARSRTTRSRSSSTRPTASSAAVP